MADAWGGAWGSGWGVSWGFTEDEPRRGGDGGSHQHVRRRRKERYKVRDQLQALLDAREAEVPKPTPKRIRAVQKAVETDIGWDVPLPAPVKAEIRNEVSQFYQSGIDWMAMAQAYQALVERLYEEMIEEEDEMILLMIA